MRPELEAIVARVREAITPLITDGTLTQFPAEMILDGCDVLVHEPHGGIVRVVVVPDWKTLLRDITVTFEIPPAQH